MRHALIVGTLAIAAASSAYGQPGDLVSRNYAVGGFDRIESAGPYNVEVRTGAAASVSATGPRELMERMIVEVRDGSLEIHPRREWVNFNRNDQGRVTVRVTVPHLRGAGLAGSGNIVIDRVSGNQFDGSVAGSGDLILQGVDVGALNLSIAGSGDARTGRGNARRVDISIAGSGGADTRGIATSVASISMAGSGRARAHSNRTADVSIVGSGGVEVVGGARCNVSKIGPGRISCS